MDKTPKYRGDLGPIDLDIGKRIRMRRLLVGMKQRELADAVGVGYQQVQKYECGVNRVGTSRLAAMADALGAPISYFLGDGSAQRSEPMPSDLLEQPGTLRLVRLYSAIRDETVPRQVLAIVEAVAEASASSSEAPHGSSASNGELRARRSAAKRTPARRLILA